VDLWRNFYFTVPFESFMPKNVAIILAWPYFGFLRHYLPDLKRIIPNNDLELLRDPKIRLNSQGQKTADYIIGTTSYPGILHEYSDRGHRAEIIEERFFLKQGGAHFQKYDLFDMQFSANLPKELIQTLESQGKQVIGWSPPELGSKAAQAALLSLHPQTASFLPQQLFFFSLDEMLARPTPLPPGIQAEYIIAKPTHASRSRMPDGSGYRVFHRSQWPRFLELALPHPNWFANCNGLLIAELIETRDPFLNNQNAVLHKVHIPGGLSDDLFKYWPLTCRKLPARLNLHRISDQICELDEVITVEAWQAGHLEDFRRELREIKNVLPPRPCLYSVDLMLRPDGRICFLEINKLAGTFIEKLYGTQCPLGLYLENLTRMGYL
jgi:hypothetical protein